MRLTDTLGGEGCINRVSSISPNGHASRRKSTEFIPDKDYEKFAGVLNGRFFIPAPEFQALLAQHNMNEEEMLAHLIQPASQYARPPISSYHVGAVGIGMSGALYVGVNLEFPHLTLYNSVHAEQCLLVNALHHGERGMKRLAVSAAPCGHCRQFYSELACADDISFYFYGKSHTLNQLLPMRFGPADLLDDPDAPLLMQPQSNKISPIAASLATCTSSELQQPIAMALEKARRSYAPYSHCPSGVAVVTVQGQAFSGGYIESAAFNPSLPPLQAALIDGVTQGLPSYDVIKEVVLVELAGGKLQHRTIMKAMLEHIVPGARLTVIEAEWDQ